MWTISLCVLASVGFGNVTVTNHAGHAVSGELQRVSKDKFTLSGRELPLSVLPESERQRLKKLAQEGHFSYDVAFAVMGEEKKDELDKVVIKNDTLRKYFPRSYTPKQMEDTIIKLLDQWQKKRQRSNER